ncbi:MAG TPA: PKD domain-containing protein [Lentimicrobium sp.]|nr:PKD domain-containing protein [Lentimicrobium sp.]
MNKYLPKVLIYFCLFFFSGTAIFAQEVKERDGVNFIKLDLTQYDFITSSLIVADLHYFKDAKVVLSDEDRIVYVYPKNNDCDEVLKRVNSLISKADMIAKGLDKKQTDSLVRTLNSTFGEWLTRYTYDGSRDNVNDSCHKAFPFCTGTIYTFPAGVGPGGPGQGNPAQVGPFYQCLSTQPNPAWYYLKIEDSGPIAIYMYSTPLVDIDFCLWGPFTDPIAPCPLNASQGGLTPNKVVDCSYSSAPTETANIPNGQTGQFYILVITNFSNLPCQITFSQSGGTGTTDCTILPPPATNNSPVCVSETIELHAADSPGAIYHWTGPNGFISTMQNPTIPNAQHIHAGMYSLTITVNGITSDPSTTEVLVLDPPTAVMTANSPTTICEGDSTELVITTTGSGPYRVALGSGSIIPMVINFPENVHSVWVHPLDTTTFYLVSVSNAGCSGEASGEITINVKPKPDPLYTMTNPCASLVSQFTDETTVSGGSPTSWDWDFGDGTPHSNLQDPAHTYAAAGNYSIVLSVIANNGCSESITVQEIIKPTPSVSAGSDVSTGYGTTTQLNGTASGGSGTHTYQWTPADKVVDATILNPMTVGMTSTVDFTLTANDQNGCQKSDDVKVTVTGGPLNALVTAYPSAICIGESTILNTAASGGSGNYTFYWTSDPPGFSSYIEDPTVTPTQTTTYFVTIGDGFTNIPAQVTVTVYPLPVVNAGDDQTIPHGTSTTLISSVSGATPPYQYEWEPTNMVNSPNSNQTTTQNIYGSMNFSLLVEDAHQCRQTDEVAIIISGGALSVNPIAESPVICNHESTKLKAQPGGGSNQYQTYKWTSAPAGYNSSVAEPIVSPEVTTTYTVEVFDGYNTVTGTVTVTVNPLPEIDLIPNDPRILEISSTEIGICVFDTIAISAGNPGASYLWSNGSVEQNVTVATSGITYDEQTYTVLVTDPLTQCSNTGTITAYFTFEYCSYGIEENIVDNRLKIYPNPSATGIFNLVIDDLSGTTSVEVYSSSGMKIFEGSYKLFNNTTFKEELNLSNATKGVYFLKLKNLEATLVKKLIIR